MYRENAYSIAKELIEKSGVQEGDIMVIGCSTSEITGNKIGSASVPEVAEEVFQGIKQACDEACVNLAAQCCEHLNRAIIVEKDVAKREHIDIVNVVPFPKAGGSFATAAYKYMDSPVAVEHIKADCGMDIGDTLIGMHLKDVAVPLRLSTDKLGEAHLVFARVRPKFIGGERAHYDDSLK